MAFEVKGLARQFKFTKNGDEITIDDPNSEMSPDEVMGFMSSQYPELTTASVHGPELEGEVQIFEFKTTVGTKG